MTTTTLKTSFDVRGFRVRTASNRRYAVVAVRPEPVRTEAGTYVAFARVEKRTDNRVTALTTADRYGRVWGAFAVVIDRVTGEEI